MNYFGKDLNLVVLKCPYEHWEDEETQRLFGKFVDLKLKGYKKEYPEGVLPLSSYDFIANLMILSDGPVERLHPIMVMKSVTSDVCKKFQLGFELAEILKKCKTAQTHLEVVEEIVKKAESAGKRVGYNSSWTVGPEARQDPVIKKCIRDLSASILTLYYSENKIDEVLIGGTLRFKVDELQKQIGFKLLQKNGTELGPVETPFLFGETVALMHLTEFSEEIKRISQFYRVLWDQRIEVGVEEIKKTAAAA